MCVPYIAMLHSNNANIPHLILGDSSLGTDYITTRTITIVSYVISSAQQIEIPQEQSTQPSKYSTVVITPKFLP